MEQRRANMSFLGQKKTIPQYKDLRLRGMDIRTIIREMVRGSFSGPEIQDIIDSAHPGIDEYGPLLEEFGLRESSYVQEHDYETLYRNCQAQLDDCNAELKLGGANRKILKAKRLRSPPRSGGGSGDKNIKRPKINMMDELASRLATRQQYDGKKSRKSRSKKSKKSRSRSRKSKKSKSRKLRKSRKPRK